jgi:mono/diheme cytochrome c family protein
MSMIRNLSLTAFGLMVMISCDRTRSTTGWDYMPDMYYSNAYESYTPNPNFDDQLTMRMPVEGTVPMDMVPYPWKKTDEDRISAGEALVNPWEATAENLTRGEAAYGIYCISCHGEKGDGQGFLFTSKKYPFPPASLINEKVTALRDGEIYHSITVGYGIMGAHGGMIRQDDRWKIILHIRENLQQQAP